MPGSDPLYNSRITDTYLRLVRKRYPFVNIEELLSHAGMKSHEVADLGHWFTQEQVDLFHERLVQLTGNEGIAREAGRFGGSPESLGVLKQGVMAFVGPARAFELIKKTAANFTRSSDYESRRVGAAKVELTITARAGVCEKPFQCENRIGTFEAILMTFNYGLPDVEHPECMFRGGSCCRYVISWKNNPSVFLKKMRNASAVLFPPLLIWSAYHPVLVASLHAVASTLAILFLLITVAAEYLEKKELKSVLESLEDPTGKLLEQINSNYSNAQITNEVGQAISRQTEIEGIIESVLGIMEVRLGYDRGVILLADPDMNRLAYRAGFGHTPEQHELFLRMDIDLRQPGSGGILGASFNERKPYLINSRKELEEAFPGSNRELLRKLGAEAFICCPIICDGQPIGILALDNIKTGKPLLQTDLNLLMGIAPVIGVSIRNAELLETKERQYDAIMQLSRIRDELTAAKETSERYAGELQLMNEEVKNFAYIVSHDLRAPLINIKGFSTELDVTFRQITPLIAKGESALGDIEKSDLRVALERDIPEALEFIDSSVRRMELLINTILKLSRLGRRELHPEPLDVGELLQGILKTLMHQLEERNVTVTIGELPPLVSDRVAIEQIFGNLLDNAVKYLERDRPGRIEISATADSGETNFMVRDNGRGIAAEEMDKVFEIFRRGGKQDTPGEGMGLAYVKTAVRALGGKILCESEPGTGTLFRITVPTSFNPVEIA